MPNGLVPVDQSASKTFVDYGLVFRSLPPLRKRTTTTRTIECTVDPRTLFVRNGYNVVINYASDADLDGNLDEDDWDRCFNINVKSHLFLMHAARPYLAEAEGAFITTASLAGVKVSGSSLAYSVTKAARIHLVKGLAIAAGPKVRVDSVSPGLMLTDCGLQFPEEKQQAARDRTPLERLATVEDVAHQVLCFAGSRRVTGANAVVDGGLSL
ncbi:hypothetical protein LZ30DRAFT_776612 [Colletotrichum cereale]|nr:hypothetical protein LZ30DRAFT_776612 [Colletotrichum cereale]